MDLNLPHTIYPLIENRLNLLPSPGRDTPPSLPLNSWRWCAARRCARHLLNRSSSNSSYFVALLGFPSDGADKVLADPFADGRAGRLWGFVVRASREGRARPGRWGK